MLRPLFIEAKREDKNYSNKQGRHDVEEALASRQSSAKYNVTGVK